MKASDIHLEPTEGCLRIRFRVHGNLLVQRKLALREGEEVLKALKLEARLLASSVGSFQSSRVRLNFAARQDPGPARGSLAHGGRRIRGDAPAGFQEHRSHAGATEPAAGILSSNCWTASAKRAGSSSLPGPPAPARPQRSTPSCSISIPRTRRSSPLRTPSNTESAASPKSRSNLRKASRFQTRFARAFARIRT